MVGGEIADAWHRTVGTGPPPNQRPKVENKSKQSGANDGHDNDNDADADNDTLKEVHPTFVSGLALQACL